ncbi:ABC transporter ATP-binding protein [Actinoplanes sp. NPDC049599]|uniref:ABC transporter ATP-binding protein n=1 Tax=Actinoplanes sp. NPDC049599 TaxID=3363903 RepID=UPI0037932197
MRNPTSDVAVEAHDLSRRYGGAGGFEAVRAVSFAVPRGQLWALLGTNGAGKTSTMEMIEGLARPSSGTVRVLGHDPYAQRAAVRPRTGVMLQEGGFPADLTVAETVRMWAGTLRAARPVEEALDAVALAPAVRVKQLSGGERRRLDLALAILGRPEVLFLDEPTTGLDPHGRRDTHALIRRLRDEGVTVLLTTHYLEEAQDLADRLAVLHRGGIVAAGSVTDIVAAHPARIGFVLRPPEQAERLPELPGNCRLEVGADGRVVVRTDRLQACLTVLLQWATRLGVDLHQLDARSASLQEAFLAITASEPIREAVS